MSDSETPSWLNEQSILETMERAGKADAAHVRAIIAKAREMKGLNGDDVAILTHVDDPALLEEIFHTAKEVKEEIYGKRIVFFAPMYITNFCANECLYCAFRKSNTELHRHALTQAEIAKETEILINQGHKRILLVAGESYPGGIEYVTDAIKTIYSVKNKNGEIRRVNINLAPMSVDNFKLMKDAGIGTYQLFQETYHRETYAKVHVRGKKADFDWRVTAFDRAMEAGIDDVGMGLLFGLADWRFEIQALMQHIAHLEHRFGVGCHTISVPRMEPANGSAMASAPPQAVSDADFKKIVAIMRLAVPYTGMIMSTRENAEMRRATYELGVSQISAGSRTNPGGYSSEDKFDESQFQLGDHRSLEEVVRELAELGYIPSFCTACYRLGRTGEDFMALAKVGDIKQRCAPNAVGTYLEYLLDYASPDTAAAGEKLIASEISNMNEREQRVANKICEKIRAGKRDVYC